MRLQTFAQATHTEGMVAVLLAAVIVLLVLKITPAGQMLFSGVLAAWCVWWDQRAPASREMADGGGGVDWLGRPYKWGWLERLLSWSVYTPRYTYAAKLAQPGRTTEERKAAA